MRAALHWLRSLGAIETLLSLSKRRSKIPTPTSRLYILRVDFPISAELREKFAEALKIYREEYGLDFLIIEPGIQIQRFDDI